MSGFHVSSMEELEKVLAKGDSKIVPESASNRGRPSAALSAVKRTNDASTQSNSATEPGSARVKSAKSVIRGGVRFPSKLEADRYTELCIAKKEGHITHFLRQVPFHFPGGIKYVIDFMPFWVETECYTYEDTKGYETEVFKLKKKLFIAHYPTLKLTLLRRKHVQRFTDEEHDLITGSLPGIEQLNTSA